MAHSRHSPATKRAADLFTDRVPEAVAFRQSIIAQRRYLDSDAPSEGSSARNVLVYHGVGGIGKTTLSTRLQAWVSGTLEEPHEWGLPPGPVGATARMDLHSSQGNFDVAGAVVALRRELSDVKPKWPAFDWAFATWWASAHPDEPLPEAGDSRDKGLASAIADTVGGVLKELGAMSLAVDLGFRAARLAAQKFTQMRDRHLSIKIVEDEEWFRDLLQRCADIPTTSDPHPELLLEVAEVLSMEMDQVQPCPLMVMFVDTYERLQVKQGHARTSEALFNSLVWNLPQVLFVITGRNRLDWDDIHRTNVEHSGPATWPGLVPGATGEPRQHLVGDLSPDDTRALVQRMRDANALPISDDVVEALVHESNGLPQYLDLACEVALKVKRNGGEAVTLDDVTGSLGDLVDRAMEDIPADEQRALRAAAMFSVFDVGLIAAAAGVDEGCATRAVKRAMVQEWGTTPGQYRMHETVREAIRHAGADVAGGWADADWQQAGQRAIVELRRRTVEAQRDGRLPDRLQATALAITLVSTEEAKAVDENDDNGDWLDNEVAFGPSISGLRQLIPSVARSSYGQGFIDFVTARSSGVDQSTREALLSGLAHSDHPMSSYAYHHWAYVLRNADKFDESIAVWDEAIGVKDTTLRRHQRLLTMTYARRYQDALNGIDSISDNDRQFRLHSTINTAHGLLDPKLAAFNLRLAHVSQSGSAREILETLGERAMHSAFFCDDAAEAERVLRDSESVGYVEGVRLALAALVILDPFRPDAKDFASRLLQLSGVDLPVPSPRAYWVILAQAWAAGDDARIAGVAEVVRATSHQDQGWFRTEVLLNHLGYPVDYPPAQWLEPFEVVEQRWIQHWHNWYDRVVTARQDSHAE